jgi:hypothetical protein
VQFIELGSQELSSIIHLRDGFNFELVFYHKHALPEAAGNSIIDFSPSGIIIAFGFIAGY